LNRTQAANTAVLARIFHVVAEYEVGGIVVSRVNTGA
jgi:hypothetical protein